VELFLCGVICVVFYFIVDATDKKKAKARQEGRFNCVAGKGAIRLSFRNRSDTWKEADTLKDPPIGNVVSEMSEEEKLAAVKALVERLKENRKEDREWASVRRWVCQVRKG
jgi:hypothetical protein